MVRAAMNRVEIDLTFNDAFPDAKGQGRQGYVATVLALAVEELGYGGLEKRVCHESNQAFNRPLIGLVCSYPSVHPLAF